MPLQSVFTEKDYYVEIWNDDDTHFIRVASFDNFDDTRAEYRRLTEGAPDMRVVMRRRAQVFEHYIPERLRRESDRRG